MTEKWDNIHRALHSCIHCLSTEHSSEDCPRLAQRLAEKESRKTCARPEFTYEELHSLEIALHTNIHNFKSHMNPKDATDKKDLAELEALHKKIINAVSCIELERMRKANTP